MELTKFLGLLAVVLPVAYGAPTAATTNLHPEILAAMKRDLGLDAAEATAVVAREVKAVDVIEQLRNKSGKSFAGAWLADGGKTINVAVTDKSLAKEVTAAGAQPTVVANSHERLQEAKAALDKVVKEQVKSLDANTDSGVAAWYVDVKSNKVVLEALSNKGASAKSLAKKAKLSEAEYEVRTVEKMPTTFASIQGGDAYIIGSARCSVGFSVTTGYVSAGHCGQAGAATTTQDGEALGQFEQSVFPGDADMSYISTVEGTTLNPTVNGYGGDGVTITGNTVAAIGASICRSGSTSGVHCGTVRNYEASVNYSEGIVTGLTETDACAEPGDSGGSFYAGDQAQGVTSGGSGDCTSGGTTYFQPVNEILDTYGLTLVTG